MKRWSVEFRSEAAKDLSELDRPVRRRIIKKLDWLAKNFDAILPLVLTGEFKRFYKLRVGDWRIIYKIAWQSRLIELIIGTGYTRKNENHIATLTA
jgi:mRNA interferase RelE/StbE